jgi:hypothetical protein
MQKNGSGRGFCNIEIDLDRLAMFSSIQAALDQFRQFQPFFGYIVALTILKKISQWEGLSPYILQKKRNHQPDVELHPKSSHLII